VDVTNTTSELTMNHPNVAGDHRECGPDCVVTGDLCCGGKGTCSECDATDEQGNVTKNYVVPESNLADLKASLEKINRKCVKLGVPQVELVENGFEDRPYVWFQGSWVPYSPTSTFHKDLKPTYRRFFKLTLKGQTPRLEGWSFVATLQHLEVEGETANILRIVPGWEEQLPKEYRSATPDNCDHCHKSIMTRKETFVVKNQDGSWKQVGRNCLADFLFGKDPHAVIKALEYLQEALGLAESAESDGGFGGRIEDRWSLLDILTLTAACVRIDGWCPRSKARYSNGQLIATADNVAYILTPPGPYADDKARADWREFCAQHEPTQEDKDIAAKALAYAKDDLPNKVEGSDYLYNLWVAANQPTVNRRLLGIVASLMPHYLREVERQILREKELKDTRNSQYVGTPGERIMVKVKVLRNWAGEGYSIINMLTSDGNVLVWFGVGGMTVGQEYWIKATVMPVKDGKHPHSEYKGVKQTRVNRVEIYNITDEQAQAEVAKMTKAAAKKAAKLAKG
jgi:hypothetical protein